MHFQVYLPFFDGGLLFNLLPFPLVCKCFGLELVTPFPCISLQIGNLFFNISEASFRKDAHLSSFVHLVLIHIYNLLSVLHTAFLISAFFLVISLIYLFFFLIWRQILPSFGLLFSHTVPEATNLLLRCLN